MRGFTLIELLIAIAIVSIMATVGIVVFTSSQSSARDSRRKQDIEEIAKSLEILRVKTGAYGPLTTSYFANGAIPLDPKWNGVGVVTESPCGNKAANNYTGKCWYCIKDAGPEGLCSSSDHDVASTYPTVGQTTWFVCANLENAAPNNYYCLQNKQ